MNILVAYSVFSACNGPLSLPVSPTAIQMEITSIGNRLAGNTFSLTCSLQNVQALAAPITLAWLGPDNSEVITQGSVLVGFPQNDGNFTQVTLTFDPLYAHLAGNYTCQATITSLPSSQTIIKIITTDVLVQSKPQLVMKIKCFR